MTKASPETPLSKSQRQELKAGINANQKKATLPQGFSFGERGLSYTDPDADNPSPLWICSRLDVTAITCDEHNLNFGRALEFKDTLNHSKKWVMPMSMLAGRGDGLHSILLDMGLSLSSSGRAKTLLAQYLQECKDLTPATCVFKTGWFRGAYVLPDRTLGGDPQKPILFQTDNPLLTNFESKGTLQEWQDHVAAFGVGNSRINFAISASFTATLLSQYSMEGGGFHFRGESSKGKTITIYAAGSVWGSHKRKRMWRATSNGLEMAAYNHNDSILLLDEMGEMNPKEIGQTVYMLANGQAKQRANDVRMREWRLLFLSTGEMDLKTAMEAADDPTKAGQEVRMLDLEAVAGEYGVFDVLLNGFETSKDQAEALQKNTAEYYGTAGIEFLNQLIKDKDEARDFFNKIKAHFIKNETPKDANSQIERAIGRFAFVAAGGELASKLGVTGWELGEAYSGVKACFDNWKSNLASTTQSHEQVNAIKLVKSFIAKHGESRFTNLKRVDDDHAPKTVNRAGWREDLALSTFYHFDTDVFKGEVCRGLDSKLVLRALKTHGYLKTESGGTTQRLTWRGLRIGENQKTNTYAVDAKILEHE